MKKGRAGARKALGTLAAAERLPLAERYARGKGLRETCPRESHAFWKMPSSRPDPIMLVLQADKGRIPELLHIRHGRIAASPFNFFRGSALNMAMDLSTTPATGVRVQCGGDSHLGNFRCFATPERRLIFAVNDLDETLPAPWEWDIKRLACSVVIACRENGLRNSVAKSALLACVRSYREHMTEFSRMNPLDLWYFAIDSDMLMSSVRSAQKRRRAKKRIETARARNVAEDLFPQIARASAKAPGSKDMALTLGYANNREPGQVDPAIKDAFARYRNSLRASTQVLLDRFVLKDATIKVVGVGSVGTACWVLLLTDGEGNSLVLQLKEARASVLEAYAGKSVFANHGRRVENGHRLMQPASDIFLGWTAGKSGRHYYVRQLRDVKIKFAVETYGKTEMTLFADWCGHSLALSHARASDPAVISGYLGKSDAFDLALAAFSVAYADQNESDHTLFKRAIHSGRVTAIVDEPNRPPVI